MIRGFLFNLVTYNFHYVMLKFDLRQFELIFQDLRTAYNKV